MVTQLAHWSRDAADIGGQLHMWTQSSFCASEHPLSTSTHRGLQGDGDCLVEQTSSCEQQSRLPYKRPQRVDLHIHFSAWQLTLYQPKQEV